MGINGLWEVLGKGDEYGLADYAAAHWEQHKRPLRIAVDEACWRFNNLTDEQVVKIREGEPAANPIEKTILWRILRFWKLNIQLIFVTDGLRKPGKKRWGKKPVGGRGGGKVDKDVIRMLHKMFDRLHVPYHEAPGEAEAECARLQQLGVVDAVWSDDGDCLMFGCTTLIKAHRNASGKKEWDRVQVYRAETILTRFNFDADSLMMFAVVSGGDYDDKGLPGCGPQTTKKLVQPHVGLAKVLRSCAGKPELVVWRNRLVMTLREMGYASDVPYDFPDLKALNGYRNPAVSPDDRCRNLRGLRIHQGGWQWWENQMDQTKLRIVLRNHYNFKTREFLKHLAPVFLARALTRNVTPARREENLSYNVILRRTNNRKGKDGEDLGRPSEVNIKFDAALLVQIDLSVQPPEEDWSSTVKNDGCQYDPMKPIDGEMLSCFLEYGLPEGALDKPPTSLKRKSSRSGRVDEVDEPESSQTGSCPLPSSTTTPTAKKSRKTKQGERTPSLSPPPAAFKRLRIPHLVIKKAQSSSSQNMPAMKEVINLEDDTDSEVEMTLRPASLTPASSTAAKEHLQEKSHNGEGAEKDGKRVSRMSATIQRERAKAPASNSTKAIGAAASLSQFGGTKPSASPLSSSFMDSPASSKDQLGLPSSAATESDVSVTPSAATLRQRREAGLLSKLSKPLDAAVRTESAFTRAPPASVYPEVIDLT